MSTTHPAGDAISGSPPPPPQQKQKQDEAEEGFEGMTFERKYFRSGTSFVKRSLRPSEYQTGFHGIFIPPLGKERLQNEAACLRFIASHTDIPVPRVLADFQDSEAFYLITEFIEGLPMSDLPLEKKAVLRQELDRHIKVMQSFKSHKMGGPLGHVIVPKPVMDQVPEWALRPSNKDEFVFCHNDLSESNVIVDPERLVIRAILDWEYAGFWPAFFEQPLYTRWGPGAVMGSNEERTQMMLAFLRAREDDPSARKDQE